MLAQLESAWQHRALILAAAVAFLVAFAKVEQEKIAALKAQLSARPAETENVKVVRVAGPVRVVTKTIYVPGKPGEVASVEQFIDRAPVTTEEVKTDVVAPACPPAPRAPWRYVDVTLDPLGYGQPRALGAGVAFWNAEAGLNYDWKYHALGLDARVRF